MVSTSRAQNITLKPNCRMALTQRRQKWSLKNSILANQKAPNTACSRYQLHRSSKQRADCDHSPCVLVTAVGPGGPESVIQFERGGRHGELDYLERSVSVGWTLIANRKSPSD